MTTKKKILVLAALTNGHEATLALQEKLGWRSEDCEIIFCDTHDNIFRQLTEGPSFAVIPVKNTIVGEITENTQKIGQLRQMGYNLVEVSSLDLQINHCLLAKEELTSLTEIEGVISHEKAIKQCGNFLDAIGIPQDHRGKHDSTGNAAKYVSRLPAGSKMAAIAPKAAAGAYGLRVLAEKIQDTLDNKTTFLLLKNDATVTKVTVGIIGNQGKYGKFLTSFFTSLGCKVIGWDKATFGYNLSGYIAKKADVLIFAVPVNETPTVISSLTKYTRDDQLLMDVTSVKQPAIDAMLHSKAQVVGLHPMFAPDVSFEGQTVVVCPARLTSKKWKTWLVNVLSATKATLKWSNSAEHDLYMTGVQATPHTANLASALLLMEMGISAKESLEFTSPFYRVMFSLMGRLLSQNPNLYASIAMENPGTVAMLEKRIAIEQNLLKIVRNKDYESFCNLFEKAKEHFGKDVAQDANELFVRLLSVLKTLHGKNSRILEFSNASDQPGLLNKILQVFSSRGINLTGINSVHLGEGRLQFAISFEQSRSSDDVRKALEEIEDWQDTTVKVIK